MDDLLTVGDASRVLDLTSRYVQDLADQGRLPVMRTARGLRLFKRSDVERLAEERGANGAQVRNSNRRQEPAETNEP